MKHKPKIFIFLIQFLHINSFFRNNFDKITKISFGNSLSIEELERTLSFLEEKIKGQKFNLKTSNKIFFDIINRKRQRFEVFQSDLRSNWDEFKGSKDTSFIKKNYSDFFNRNFHEIIIIFLERFFGLEAVDSLRLVSKEKLSSELLLFEYTYTLSKREATLFQKYRKRLNLMQYGLFFHLTYLYLIFSVLNIILKEIIDEEFQIALEGATLNQDGSNNFIHFLVIIKGSRNQFYDYYYKMILFYFFKQFRSVPKNVVETLESDKEKLFELALQCYSKSSMRKSIVELLYFFYKKCTLLKSIRPLLDFFNFVCSRVEDSIYSKLNIIKSEYLNKLDYDTDTKNNLIKIFNYLDRTSTLSSTFLANNLPSRKSQSNLFSLYKKYYFGMGLETLESSNILFLPNLFRKTLNQHNHSLEENNIVNSNSIKNVNRLFDYFIDIIDIESSDVFFQKILNKSIFTLNFEFFKTFFRSLNKKFLFLISHFEKEKASESQDSYKSFDFIVAHISRMLYVLIDKIFLDESPKKASKNFIDKRGRYIPKNIALRVLELLIFQDMNFSDDLWPDFLLSMNKERVLERLKEFNIEIHNKYFYTDEDLTRLLITYNFQSYSQDSKGRFLEVWLIKDIIVPCNEFILKIWNSLTDKNDADEIYETLCTFFSEGIEDEMVLSDITSICKKLTPFWKEMIV
ncbi:MAG: hypothetical protein BAJALOKI1v1_190025 [Promethearchaeota archaeon]|nr:MAG: hypothetical protein BAJALOKI1v1_190025 [Candidatus Lokiarchaeota archaeon]